MAGPVDPRLWSRVSATRGFTVLTAVLSAAKSLLVVVQALMIATLVANLVNDGATPNLPHSLVVLLGIAAGQAALTWAQEFAARRSASRVTADLRERLIMHAVALGPRWGFEGGNQASSATHKASSPDDGLATERTEASTTRQTSAPPRGSVTGAEIAVTATQGLDALEPYFVRYLPALILTALVTPVVLAVIASLDWIAFVLCLISLPLVPVFMWLIGKMTAGTSERRLAVVAKLGAQTLDLLTGLPTLRAFGRQIGPGQRVRELGDASRRASLATLRFAFLSSMVLELLTTITVAMVAVSVGLRLVDGGMSLRAGLAVIMLAPEVFAPLRQVAAQFHASTNGMAAADAAFSVLDEPVVGGGTGFLVTADGTWGGFGRTGTSGGFDGAQPPESGVSEVIAIELDDVSVIAADRDALAPASLNARIEIDPNQRGRIIALTGPSGAGKTTTELLMLGLLEPSSGKVILETADGQRLSPAEYGLENWWQQLIWLPQRPALDPDTAAYSVGQRHRIALAEALAEVGGEQLLPNEARGFNLRDGARGFNLRDGARGLDTRDDVAHSTDGMRNVLLLDEPTAHLDAATEQQVLDTLCAWRDSGRTAIVIAHRPALIEIADEVVEVRSAKPARQVEDVLV